MCICLENCCDGDEFLELFVYVEEFVFLEVVVIFFGIVLFGFVYMVVEDYYDIICS